MNSRENSICVEFALKSRVSGTVSIIVVAISKGRLL